MSSFLPLLQVCNIYDSSNDTVISLVMFYFLMKLELENFDYRILFLTFEISQNYIFSSNKLAKRLKKKEKKR